jgi:hypothetical protein
VIASLEDAWAWYQGVKTLTSWMKRMGLRYWEHEAVAPLLARDARFRDVEQEEITRLADRVSGELDDLCVLLLFSVFESAVRDQALAEVTEELPTTRHPALKHALKGLRESLEQGSFARVLEAYKELDPNLIEQVSQVRRFRNWVAHGRRGAQPDAVDPETAYRRLQQFLDLMTRAEREGASGDSI